MGTTAHAANERGGNHNQEARRAGSDTPISPRPWKTRLPGAQRDGQPGPVGARRVLVTGVGRRRGIGFAIARRLLADGAAVYAHSWTAHDAAQPHGADPAGIDGVLRALGAPNPRLAHAESDLARPDTPSALLSAAVDRFGRLDTLVCNHARSSAGGPVRAVSVS